MFALSRGTGRFFLVFHGRNPEHLGHVSEQSRASAANEPNGATNGEGADIFVLLIKKGHLLRLVAVPELAYGECQGWGFLIQGSYL